MKFFILLVCLLLQTFLNIRAQKQKHVLLTRYEIGIQPVLNRFGFNQGWGAFFGLLIPVFIVTLLLNMLFSTLSLLYVIFGIVILMLCLDINDMKKQLGEYFKADAAGDAVKTQMEAEQFVQQEDLSTDKKLIVRTVTEAIFQRSLTNIFSVIFWFMMLGPLGAVIYYVTASLAERSEQPEHAFPDIYTTATMAKEILDWLPIRVLGLTFALIGHFAPVFNIWIDKLGGGLSENKQLLIETGFAALNLTQPGQSDTFENQQALDLIRRSLWTWVIIIGVLTMTAWIF